MSKSNRNTFFHYFHVIATQSRFSFNHLPDDVAQGDVRNIKFLDMLPKKEQWEWMRDVPFTVLLGQLVQPRLKFMEKMQHCVITKIDHEHFEASTKKTQEVFMHSPHIRVF